MHPENTLSPPDLERILKFKTPSLLGIFWFTKIPFLKLPRGFIPLDYLLDGLLVKNYRHFTSENKISSDQRVHLFTTSHFQETLFVAHIWNQSEKTESDFSTLLNLIKSQNRPEAAPAAIAPTRDILVMYELDEKKDEVELLSVVEKSQKIYQGHGETPFNFKVLNFS